MSTLTNKIESVNTFLNNGHDTTAFIYFKVNDFELDTRDVNSFKHYAISLENKKTGVGVGNEFTLKIAYHMDFSHMLNTNINEFEKSLATLINSSLNANDINAINELKSSKNKCILQYGYLSSNDLITETYEGMLLTYKVNANKQIVEYTLQGYSGEKAAIGIVSWYPKIKNVSSNGIAELGTLEEIDELTTQEREELVNKLNNVYYTSPIKCNPYIALKLFIEDYNNNMKTIAESNSLDNITQYRVVDETNLGLDTNYNYLRSATLSLCRNQTPVDYIEYLVSMFTPDKVDYGLLYLKQEYEIVDRFIHEFRRNKDNWDVIDIVIKKLDSNVPNYDYWFKGYTLDNNLLIDYNLTYDGTVALAVADNIANTNDNNTIYINERGQITAKAVLTRDMFVAGSLDEILIQEQNTWLDRMSCANNCSMTTFGLPFEIAVSSVFRVTLYINNVPHHSSGNCFVTGITDTISNGSFTTNFSMIRLPGKAEDVDVFE